jgi:hypothetical protein
MLALIMSGLLVEFLDIDQGADGGGKFCIYSVIAT